MIFEHRPRAEVTIITVVVVETAVRAVEVPRIVGVVVSARASLLVYVELTIHE